MRLVGLRIILLLLTQLVIVYTYGLKRNKCELNDEKKSICDCNDRGIGNWTKALRRMPDECTKTTTLDLSNNKVSTLESYSDRTEKSCCFSDDLDEVMPSGKDSRPKPGPFFTLPRLKSINLGGNRIQKLTSCIFTGLDDLETLNLSNNKITTICDYSFRNSTRLKVLYLQMNDIKYLRRNHFKGLEKLQLLNISDNGIRQIDSRTFEDLSNLKELYLRDNIIYTHMLKSIDFSGLVELQTLDLSKNSFRKVIGLNVISSLLKLRLDENDIRKIGGSSFRNLNKLQILSLKRNGLKSINNIVGSAQNGRQLRQLEYLYLSQNRIKNVSSRVWKAMSNLKELWLDSNEISEVPPGLNKLTNLQKLVLRDNKIVSVDFDMFTPLSKLSIVILSQNMIQDVLVGDISVTSSQESNCTLNCFNNTQIFPSVRIICLEDNKLQTVSGSMLQMFPNLEHLYLAGNMLKCDCFSAPLSQFIKTHPNKCGCTDIEVTMDGDESSMTCLSTSEVPSPVICSNYFNTSIADLTCNDYMEWCSEEGNINREIVSIDSSKTSFELDCFQPSNTSGDSIATCWYLDSKSEEKHYAGEQLFVEIEGVYTCLAIYSNKMSSTIYEVNFQPANVTMNMTSSVETSLGDIKSDVAVAETAPSAKGILFAATLIIIPVLIILIIGLLCMLRNITTNSSFYSSIINKFKGSDESLYAEIDDIPMALKTKALEDQTMRNMQIKNTRYTSDDTDYLSPRGQSKSASVQSLESTVNGYLSRCPDNANSYLTIIDDALYNNPYEICGQTLQGLAASTQYYEEPYNIKPKIMRIKSLDFDVCAIQDGCSQQSGCRADRKQKKHTMMWNILTLQNPDDDLSNKYLKRTWTM
ncbi:uncharacterized protein [Antedon mediterranea]|uniref:uncharacterized protein n=1 Tax=Antedon mediterranea TaxID=105859 RepID=UPI003AF5059F